MQYILHLYCTSVWAFSERSFAVEYSEGFYGHLFRILSMTCNFVTDFISLGIVIWILYYIDTPYHQYMYVAQKADTVKSLIEEPLQ